MMHYSLFQDLAHQHPKERAKGKHQEKQVRSDGYEQQ
jgi:hypothetical protein